MHTKGWYILGQLLAAKSFFGGVGETIAWVPFGIGMRGYETERSVCFFIFLYIILHYIIFIIRYDAARFIKKVVIQSNFLLLE